MKMKKNLLIPIICIMALTLQTVHVAGEYVLTRIDVVLDKVKVNVDGQPLQVSTILYNGTTYVPVTAVSEALGASTSWDGVGYVSSIMSPGYVLPVAEEAPTPVPTEEVIPTPDPDAADAVTSSSLDTKEYINVKYNSLDEIVLQYEDENTDDWVEECFDLVNERRAYFGLPPYNLNPDLQKIAQLKAEDMCINRYYDHISPTYGAPDEMIKHFGINYYLASENIARGRIPSQVMTSWMGSESHQRSILSETSTDIGIGFASMNNNAYWVQMFIAQ